LNIYNNTLSGDSIQFRIYDASTGTTFVNVTPEMKFVDNAIVGTVLSPITFIANAEVRLEIPLKSGWTWVSFPLKSKQLQHSNLLMASVKASESNMVRSSNTYDLYSSMYGWLGSIGSFTNNKSYQIKVGSKDTLVFTGMRIHPDSASALMEVATGWNWIGFISTKNSSVNAAMANYQAADGDILKSQHEFAYYDSNLGWIGSLTAMRPGLGYMLKSGSSSTFRFPLSVYYEANMNASRLGDEQTHEETLAALEKYFNYQPEIYEKTMSVIVKSNVCEALKTNEVALVAFDGNNTVRGYALPIYHESVKDYLYYLTVYGDGPEDALQLKFVNLENGVILSSTTSLSFSSDAILGEPSTPLFANVSASNICALTEKNTEVLNIIHAYPNPFQGTLELEFNTEVNVVVSLTDIVGNEKATVSLEKKRRHSWDLSKYQLPAGVYILITKGDVNTTQKLIRTGN
jgi:hypothetical protein